MEQVVASLFAERAWAALEALAVASVAVALAVRSHIVAVDQIRSCR